MKQVQLVEVITKRLKRMKKLSGEVLEKFDMDDIHDLRVEYKKLRSLIRLIQLEANAPKLKVPGKLKSVYETGGPVRDIQLFIPRLSPYFYHFPTQVFLNGLEQKLATAKQELKRAIEQTSFEKVEESVIGSLPDHLNDEAVKKFVEKKIQAVKSGLSNIQNDEDLHSVRKQLKDLINVIKVYRNEWKLPFPVNTGISEDDLNEAGTLLGEYNDLCFAINFLQLNRDIILPIEEKQILESIEKWWLNEKESKHKEVLKKLTSIL